MRESDISVHIPLWLLVADWAIIPYIYFEFPFLINSNLQYKIYHDDTIYEINTDIYWLKGKYVSETNDAMFTLYRDVASKIQSCSVDMSL